MLGCANEGLIDQVVERVDVASHCMELHDRISDREVASMQAASGRLAGEATREIVQ
jgi:hypothetical protein